MEYIYIYIYINPDLIESNIYLFIYFENKDSVFIDENQTEVHELFGMKH